MSEEKRVSGNTAKKQPRGKPFTGAADPRNNTAGQRSKEVVATVAKLRELYVQVLAEEPNLEVDAPTRLELIARTHVKQAQAGDAGARESLYDRLWGKSAQPVTGADGGPLRVVLEEVVIKPFDANN